MMMMQGNQIPAKKRGRPPKHKPKHNTSSTGSFVSPSKAIDIWPSQQDKEITTIPTSTPSPQMPLTPIKSCPDFGAIRPPRAIISFETPPVATPRDAANDEEDFPLIFSPFRPDFSAQQEDMLFWQESFDHTTNQRQYHPDNTSNIKNSIEHNTVHNTSCDNSDEYGMLHFTDPRVTSAPGNLEFTSPDISSYFTVLYNHCQ